MLEEDRIDPSLNRGLFGDDKFLKNYGQNYTDVDLKMTFFLMIPISFYK